MEDSSATVERNPVICARMNCTECNDLVLGRPVPEACPYDILHVIEKELGSRWQNRRTGKTMDLMRASVELAERFSVYYVCRTADMGRHVKNRMVWTNGKKPEKLHFVSLGQMKHGSFRGYEPGLVMLDEVRPGEVEPYLVPKACYPVAMARWT